jgi:hypothetical protein
MLGHLSPRANNISPVRKSVRENSFRKVELDLPPKSSMPMAVHVEFNPYYEHQNNTGKSPNQQLNQLGLMLSILF